MFRPLAVHTHEKVENVVVGKPSRTPEQLRAMVQIRLNTELAREGHGAGANTVAPVVGMPELHRRDVLGRNWDIDALQHGRGHVAAFRAIVEELRLGYDLSTPDHL